MIRSYLKSYCEKSTIHGVVYIGNPKSHIIERFKKTSNLLRFSYQKFYRLFWIFSLAVSLIFTALLIFELIENLMKNPIVFLLDDKPFRVSEINFPSVTLCPGLCPIVDRVDYKLFIDEIKSGRKDLSNFTKRE